MIVAVVIQNKYTRPRVSYKRFRSRFFFVLFSHSFNFFFAIVHILLDFFRSLILLACLWVCFKI